jgi:FlaA1/EpsC-like NDP-sugar epimerase
MGALNRSVATPSERAAAIGVQLLFAFLSCALAYAVIDRSASGSHATAVLIMTLLFASGQLMVGGGMLQKDAASIDARELAALIFASAASAVVAVALQLVVPPSLGLEFGPIIAAAVLVVSFNVVLRAARSRLQRLSIRPRPNAQRTIVVGSGKAAASVVQLIEENQDFNYVVVGCVDDEILSRRVGNKPIIGTIDDLPDLIAQHKIACVLIAIPFVSQQLAKRVMNACVRTVGRDGKRPSVKILPGFLELLNGGVTVSRIRPVQTEDLLPRDPVKVDLARIAPHVANRVILVTGAGGSIGSELCRQIVGLDPSLLLLLGHGENSLFDISEELRLKFGFQRTKIVLADVADAARIRHVFSQYHPHVVFHSAAHKHVPIVETNVCEAVRNNVMGTHVVALAAAAAGTAKFVLLSTDKAVNPASVMGATKRVAELISQSFLNQTGTEFVTVRFGNVLESRGSVIPVFKRQIEQGGPVTITHRDMQRYFMTIPEAVSLVMMAMAIGRDGQVLVLDMGKPIKILQLAETLITLSGLTPYRDIAITEIGIRPGEKLYEEFLTSYEGLSTTSHERLYTAKQERVAYDSLAQSLKEMEVAIRTEDQATILHVLQDLVPSFAPGGHLFDAKPTIEAFDLETAVGTVVPQSGSSIGGNGYGEELIVIGSTDPRAKDGSHATGAIN